jgi:hypothetical protein
MFFDRFPVFKIASFSVWTFDTMTAKAAKMIADRIDILFFDLVKIVWPHVISIRAECLVRFLGLGLLKR